MDDEALDLTEQLSRRHASDAVTGLGWRYVLGMLKTLVPVRSMAHAAGLGSQIAAACGEAADRHLRMDLRPDRVDLALQSAATGSVTRQDVALAGQISAALASLGERNDAGVESAAGRSVQVLEIAIDAMNIPAVRPFWKAVMGYADEPGGSGGPGDALADPLWQGPAIWFQQMDAPRAQRNRIHFDVSVPHDEAPGRSRAALAAGGAVVSDAEAPAFWVLADQEGNEACVTAWQGRDP